MFSTLAVFCGSGTVVPCGHSLSARLFSRKLPRQGFPGSAIIVASDRQYDRCQRRTEFDVGSDRASFEVKKLETYGHPFSYALSATPADLATADETPISRGAACRLFRTDAEVLPSLLSAAQVARARFKPAVITYSRKVFLPLTNLCRDYCGYCTFRRDSG